MTCSLDEIQGALAKAPGFHPGYAVD